MDIKSCYNILKISPESTDEEVAKAFRIMALKYHPDKLDNTNLEYKSAFDKSLFISVYELTQLIKNIIFNSFK